MAQNHIGELEAANTFISVMPMLLSYLIGSRQPYTVLPMRR